VADALNRAGLGTLLLDLRTTDEARDRTNGFDIGVVSGRLRDALAWLRRRPDAEALRLGLFGASTGAAAALWVAAEPDADVAAVVSRGGRPDLAAARLEDVRAPTLLIVGGNDPVVLEVNARAQIALRCPNQLQVVPGASHLFEEPGTLAAAADLACDWFLRHLPPGRGEPRSA
jgi:putative phosphoribosyl transferase